MRQRIPLDFPKVWPYSPEYRGHVAKALSLKETTSFMLGLGLLLIVLGLIGMFLFGFFEIFIPARLFGCLVPLGIALSVIGHRRHKNEFAKVIADVKKQVGIESTVLKLKASIRVDGQDPEDSANMAVMESAVGRHYTSNWAWVRNNLLNRDRFSCCLCGRPVQLADSVAHHITAFSEGGRTEFSNLATICVECHSIIHPWLNPKLNLFWIRFERGRVYCWNCKSRLDTSKIEVIICSDCGWLHHIDDGACGCNYPGR